MAYHSNNGSGVSRRTLLQGAAALGASMTLPFAGARAQTQNLAGRQYVAQSFGGDTATRFENAVYLPFDKASGAANTQVPMQSTAAFARMRAEASNPQLDMYIFSGGQERLAAAEGLTETLDKVPNFDKLPAGFRDEGRQWVTISNIAQGLIYRTDKFKTPPRSYKDLFNPELEGHVAFMGITTSYGMDFLVMLARTFGGGEQAIDPGFENMARLSPKATIFKAASDIPTLFAQGDIWVMPNDSANAFKNREAGLPVAFAAMEEGVPAVAITGCVAKNAANADVGQAVIDYALGEEAQIALARNLRWAPSNPDVVLPEDIAGEVPRTADLLQLDRAAINTNREAWVERWNREINK